MEATYYGYYPSDNFRSTYTKKTVEYHSIFPSFSWGILCNVMCFEQTCINILWIFINRRKIRVKLIKHYSHLISFLGQIWDIAMVQMMKCSPLIDRKFNQGFYDGLCSLNLFFCHRKCFSFGASIPSILLSSEASRQVKIVGSKAHMFYINSQESKHL